MSNEDKIIQEILKSYSDIKSESSFSYVVDYYLRTDIGNHMDAISKMIYSSKQKSIFFNSAMRRFYSEAIVDKNYTPYDLLMNSSNLIGNISQAEAQELYISADNFLNKTGTGAEEKKLVEILNNSKLKEKAGNLD